jgi:hypothetical protein
MIELGDHGAVVDTVEDLSPSISDESTNMLLGGCTVGETAQQIH